jgi:DNA polymerase-3 subunit beta
MLFRTTKGIFQDALEKVVRACTKTNLNENLDGVLLEVKDGKVTLMCTDLITTIKAAFTCMDFENGAILVNSKFLLSYVKALPNQELLIKSEEKDNSVSIVSGKSQSNIVSMDINAFPVIKPIKSKVEVNVISEEFKKALKEVIFAVAHDETRPVLTGVFFEVKNGKLTLVALDGYRMCVSSLPVDCDENVSFIVPQKSALELQRILENDEQNVNVKISKGIIEFAFNEVFISSVPLEGSYIKWEKIIPENSDTVCTIDRMDLASVLSRAAAILTGENKLVKLSFTKDGKLDLLATSSIGKIEEEIKVKDFQGAELKIAFNSKYLSDVLLSHEEDELEFDFSNNASPVVIRKKDSDNYIGIVLPVRLINVNKM